MAPRAILLLVTVPVALLVHPGYVLKTDYLEPLGLSQNALARALNVDPRRMNAIVQGKRAVSLDTAMRLSCYFGTTVAFWMNLQGQYDRERNARQLPRLRRTIVPHASTSAVRA